MHLLLLAAMAVVISTVFCWFYQEAIREGEPIYYTGDSLKTLAQIQAIGEGTPALVFPKTVARLNAPSEAWWSDYPHSDLIFWLSGCTAKLSGSFIAANLAVWICLILASATFYGVAYAMGIQPVWAAALGTLFALSPYGFVRQLEHLILTAYFVVPLILWIAWRLFLAGETGEKISQKEGGILLALSFVCGLFNPYYLAVIFLFLGFLAMGGLYSRRWTQLFWIGGIAGVALLGFFIQNMDHFLIQAKHGANPGAISRELWWMTKFGLYLPDMVLPRFHQSEWLRVVGGRNYHFRIPEALAGESQTAYIGFAALLGLAGLLLVNFAQLFGGKKRCFDPLFLFALVLFLFAVTGGLNYLAGAFGMQLFRASNRYSIFFMAIGLLVLGLFLSKFLPQKWWTCCLACAALAFGLWDQIPYVPDWQKNERAEGRKRFQQDRIFFPKVEESLPENAKIFQLPVHFFPEMGKVHEMEDYEHFRPYLHTKKLHFSYGTIKGRAHMRWQEGLDFLGNPAKSLSDLVERGFAAILVNRRAYQDKAEKLSEIFREQGWTLQMENGDFLLFEQQLKK